MDNKRSIQDIIPPARSKPIRTSAAPQKEVGRNESPSQNPPRKPPRPPKIRKGGNKGGMFGLVGILVLVLIVVGAAFGIVSTFFHRADVLISLKQYSVPVAESFEASSEGTLLSFSERSVSETLTRTVSRSGSEYVEERASGTITIFNAYSKSSQRLITNTRFESTDGLIYRVQSPVVVPGYTTDANGAILPGQIDVTVYADEAGEQYNIGVVDFTIPGLKGSPQFESMSARSKTALSGGFVGEKAVVSPEVRDAAVAELRSELDRVIRAKIADSVSATEVFFPDTISVTFFEQPDKTVDGGALVSVTGEARAPIFDQNKLARVIAQEGGVSYESELRISNVSELAILTETSEIEGNIRLTVSGEANLVGAYDQDRLINDLSGKDRRNVGVVLSGYPAIEDMKISVYPFWRGMLPEDPSRIKVQIEENPQ